MNGYKRLFRILAANQIYLGKEKSVIMKKLVVSVIIIGILLWRCTDGCLDYERNALMELMDSFHLPPDYMVGEDCCQWYIVTCNSTTGRVVELSISGYYNDQSENYYFNASLFLPFHQLNTLRVDFFNFVGCVHDQCFERLSQMKKLESLDLRRTNFKNRSVLSSIANISSLRSLSLAVTGFEGMDEIQWLSKLEKLESLDLDGNNFNSSKLLSLPVISSLKALYLEDCGLKGTVDIEELMGSGTSLKNLSLAGNEIESFGGGGAEFQSFGNLEYLNLRHNLLNNSILSSLNHCFSLKYLYIDGNKLEGSINLEELDALGNLEVLDLSGNQIDRIVGSKGGCAEFQSFGNLELLDLSYNFLDNSILLSLNHCFSLKYLNIGYNKLQGSINLEEWDARGNLEVLDLSGNQINKVVGSKGVNVSRNLRALYLDDITDLHGRSKVQLHSFGAYPHLKTIYLMENQFEGPIFVEEGHLTNVEELYLNRSSMDKESFQSLSALPSLKYLSLSNVNATQPAQGLSNLTNLEYLDMSSCTADGSFLKDIGRMISLKTLTLDNSGLKGTIPAIEGLCNLRHLEELDIRYNELSGTLPWCITNLTSLENLDLSRNHFSGKISPLRSLTSLQKLEFSSNQFQVPISLEPFFNHSKLKYLNAGNNSQIYEDEEINLSPKFQLQTLYLSSPGNGGAFPKFLYHQHDLQEVDLSNIKLKGEFPYWLLVNNTKLSTLFLANTSLSGSFQLPNDSAKYVLDDLDISNNKFNASIPTNIGQVLPNLKFLNLSENGFMGSIPSSFGKMSGLAVLDLSNNSFSGIIPEDLYIGCYSLSHVILSHNDFEGQILPKQANCDSLETLLFDGNHFTGNIPHSLLNCSILSTLDLSNNHLSGNIPGWIVNISHLNVLDLSTNNFSRNIPSHLCHSFTTELYLSNNQLQGSLGTAFYNCNWLVTLDLSHNHLTWNIPKWIGKLSSLSYILFSHNNLQGELPIELCNLSRLSLIDFSNNNMSGSVLSCLKTSSKYRQPKIILYSSRGSRPEPSMQRPLEFTMKDRTLEFQGSTLKYISGIDLSCNNFTGEIPVEIGNLSMIQVLNLSHNSLTGPIPQSFANLKEIESLDLSYNNLNGKIPPQLTQLTFVSDFSVAYNNLSGKTPEMVRQFATFDKSSYEGNPFLCGLPLKSCQTEDSSTNSIKEEEGGFIDLTDFYVSFLISYVIVLLSIAAVLYINPYWRRAWFYLIEVSLRNCYYFIEDIIIALRKLRAS